MDVTADANAPSMSWRESCVGARQEYTRYGITGTYKTAYQALAEAASQLPRKGRALDVGCGGGRSAAFIKQLGFEHVEGVDIDAGQVALAQQNHPDTPFRVINGTELSHVPDGSVDLVTSMIVLMEIPSLDIMTAMLREMKRVVSPEGIIFIVTNTSDALLKDWTSFEGTPFQTVAPASGERIKCRLRGTDIVFTDYYWTEADYAKVFKAANAEVVQVLYPLAPADEQVPESVAPFWLVYILK